MFNLWVYFVDFIFTDMWNVEIIRCARQEFNLKGDFKIHDKNGCKIFMEDFSLIGDNE